MKRIECNPMVDYLIRPDKELIEVDAKFLEWKRSGHTIILHDGKQLPGSDINETDGKHPYEYQLGTIYAIPLFAQRQDDCPYNIGMRVVYRLNMSKRYWFDDELVIVTNGGIWGIVKDEVSS